MFNQKRKKNMYELGFCFRVITFVMPLSFMYVRMRQIFHPSVLPILQHENNHADNCRGENTMFYRRRSHPSSKSKAP